MFEKNIRYFLQIPINKRGDGLLNMPGFSTDDILEVEAISRYISNDGKKEIYLIEKSNNETISNEFFKISPQLVVEIPFGLRIETRHEEPFFKFFFIQAGKRVYLYLFQGVIRKTKQEGGEVLFHFEDSSICNLFMSEVEVLNKENARLIKENAELQRKIIEMSEREKGYYTRLIEYIKKMEEET